MKKELKPIKESTEDYERLEKRIKELFKREIYFPILAELGYARNTVQNDEKSALIEALRSGQLVFSQGQFSGRLSAVITRELRALGARWDARTRTFRIPLAELPLEIKQTISLSEFRFREKLERIDKKLASILPEEFAQKLKSEDLFDRTIYKTEKKFQASVKNITIAPELTDEQRRRLASEWTNNMHLWIKDFTEEEIVKLRKNVQVSAFKGRRYEAVIDSIQDSYDVSANKAKFLARQETSLLMTKLKQTRYQEAGVNKYRWKCVAGSKIHPVRPWHKKNDGKIFTWDSPPTVDDKGNRKNPGQDYNCRCYSIPIVEF